MTLTRRALLLIFPVVLMGYALAATVVFIAHESAVIGLEQARLEQQVANLAIAMRGEVAINRGLIAAFLSSNALKRFLEEKDANYRASGIEVKLRESTRLLLENPQTFISLAVLPGGSTVDYYYENSDDPFATITDTQLALAGHAVGTSKASSLDFVELGGSRPLIVHTAIIDRVTMRAPEGGAWTAEKQNELIVVQVAIRPEQFLQLRRTLEAEYAATLEFIPSKSPSSDGEVLQASAQLGDDLFVRLMPSAEYAAKLTQGTMWTLAGGTVLVSLLSVGLLMVLIRRFITSPVATFDRELTEVMEGRRQELSANLGTGEVGRLSANMKQLHDSLRKSIARVQSASLTDQLTGIANRAAFTIAATQAIRAASLQSGSCTVLFIDIDNFKFVNDRYGHDAGDELLRQFASQATVMLANLSNPDGGGVLFARLSGDEFAIVLSPPAPMALARSIADGTLALFQNGFEVAGERYPVSASIGVARYPDDASDLAELMANADAAMYQAKNGGKNQAAFFSSQLADSRRRDRAIQAELRRLNMDRECSLVYMPIVDTSGGVRGCEALLRWTSPTLGVIGPNEFIPIAERTGQFSKIDHWVIERALADFSHLKDWFGPAVILSINVSSAELHTASIAQHLQASLKAHNVPATQVEVELTETFAAGLGETTRGGVAALRAMGVRIAIDDFGAGYTSVQQITEYAADVVKLDKALVTRLATDQSRSTLTALIALCHAQGMVVVGEGVDTEEKHGNLLAAGCDFLQGYSICKPLALQQLATWQLQNILAQTDQHEAECSIDSPPSVLSLVR